MEFKPRYLLPELHQLEQRTTKAQSVDRTQSLIKANQNVEQLIQLWQLQKETRTPEPFYKLNQSHKVEPLMDTSNSARKKQSHKKTVSICLTDLTKSELFKPKEKENKVKKPSKDTTHLLTQCQTLKKFMQIAYTKGCTDRKKYNNAEQKLNQLIQQITSDLQ